MPSPLFPPEVTELLFGLADIGILLGLIIAVLFVISYAGFFNWRATDAGRALMYVFLSLIAVSTVAALARYLGQDYFGREILRLIVWWSVPIVMFRILWVLWTNYNRDAPPLALEPRGRSPLAPIHAQQKGSAMTDTNPTAPLAAGETVSSSSGKVTLGPAKAVAALAATVAVSFLGALGVAFTDNVVTGSEWITIAIATIVSTGLVGGATFVTPTSVTRNR